MVNSVEIDLPAGITLVNKSKVKIKIDDWQGAKTHTISIEDLVLYYKVEARNITNGCRRLGTIVGDWRPVDYIAKDLLEIFKVVNIEKLRKVALVNGMTPKF